MREVIQMITTTLFNHIKSELIKDDYKEQVRRGNHKIQNTNFEFLWYEHDKQYVNKIMQFDQDVKEIVNDLFGGHMLDRYDHDDHFKKRFLNHFVKRQINTKTIEEFKFKLLSVFLNHRDFINTMYHDLDKYIHQTYENKQNNRQSNKGSSTTDNRQAFADLPQTSTNLDVDDTVMEYPTDNTISRNKENQDETTDGRTTTQNRTYSLDEWFKTYGLLEHVFNEFDKKCFLQIFE